MPDLTVLNPVRNQTWFASAVEFQHFTCSRYSAVVCQRWFVLRKHPAVKLKTRYWLCERKSRMVM